MSVATTTHTNKNLIVITWDGKSIPLQYILHDGIPLFDILLFNYSGKETLQPIPNQCIYLSAATENKGQIFERIHLFLKAYPVKYHYIGILDDDLLCSMQDLNKLLFIATLENLDVFQPSIAHDSFFDHRQFIHKPGTVLQWVDWVEIMAPFYKMELFNAAYPYFEFTISGQGVDVYLMPALQRILGLPKTAVVHAVMMKHCRPIRSGKRIYSNGKSNLEEVATLQEKVKELVAANDPALFDDYFTRRILNKKYYNRITLYAKILRIKTMLKNIYHQMVNASYR